MQKIIFTAHCLLNTASKVVLFQEGEMAAEEALRRRFLSEAIARGVQLVQLPCPEFTLYGARRWGHVSDQFDNPFFRDHCRRLLSPFLLQLREYLRFPERFLVVGIVGIDGSPSCGVDSTSRGEWHGSFGGRQDLGEVLATARLAAGRGVFMDEVGRMLAEEGLAEVVPVVSLYAREPEKCLGLLGGDA